MTKDRGRRRGPEAVSPRRCSAPGRTLTERSMQGLQQEKDEHYIAREVQAWMRREKTAWREGGEQDNKEGVDTIKRVHGESDTIKEVAWRA